MILNPSIFSKKPWSTRWWWLLQNQNIFICRIICYIPLSDHIFRIFATFRLLMPQFLYLRRDFLLVQQRLHPLIYSNFTLFLKSFIYFSCINNCEWVKVFIFFGVLIMKRLNILECQIFLRILAIIAKLYQSDQIKWNYKHWVSEINFCFIFRVIHKYLCGTYLYKFDWFLIVKICEIRLEKLLHFLCFCTLWSHIWKIIKIYFVFRIWIPKMCFQILNKLLLKGKFLI